MHTGPNNVKIEQGEKRYRESNRLASPFSFLGSFCRDHGENSVTLNWLDKCKFAADDRINEGVDGTSSMSFHTCGGILNDPVLLEFRFCHLKPGRNEEGKCNVCGNRLLSLKMENYGKLLFI